MRGWSCWSVLWNPSPETVNLRSLGARPIPTGPIPRSRLSHFVVFSVPGQSTDGSEPPSFGRTDWDLWEHLLLLWWSYAPYVQNCWHIVVLQHAFTSQIRGGDVIYDGLDQESPSFCRIYLVYVTLSCWQLFKFCSESSWTLKSSFICLRGCLRCESWVRK